MSEAVRTGTGKIKAAFVYTGQVIGHPPRRLPSSAGSGTVGGFEAEEPGRQEERQHGSGFCGRRRL
jgi:hypothetical protein